MPRLPAIAPSEVSDVSPLRLADATKFVVAHPTEDGYHIVSQHRDEKACKDKAKRAKRFTHYRDLGIGAYRIEGR